jgi:hypothetical protein
MAFDAMEDERISKKRHKPEEIVTKLWQVEVLTAQKRPVSEDIPSIGVTEVTYYRWRSEYGGLKCDQVKFLKELEAENNRLRRAVSDLTIEKLILKEAASGPEGHLQQNFETPLFAVRLLSLWLLSTASRNNLHAVFWGSIDLHSARSRQDLMIKQR